MEEITSEQRAALDAAKASRGSCPPAETLVAYEAMSADDRARQAAHGHITICSRCQLVLLHAAEPATAASSRLRWMLPLAAVLVLGLGYTLVWRAGALAPAATGAGDVETVRGTAIQSVAPIGSVETVTEFSWQSPIQADRYRVSVTRGSDRVWRDETSATRIEAPAGIFDANVEYRWVVEAIDREGEVRMTSPPQSFTVIPPRR